ncbi:hypothetical protein SDC9_200380 [bioreactor metagenome]|uniref:Uncharacterized protein n=1 Tax=bioreactor metagenome TaxID=1076179 RepID=A0A645IN31_9ZZZZ
MMEYLLYFHLLVYDRGLLVDVQHDVFLQVLDDRQHYLYVILEFPRILFQLLVLSFLQQQTNDGIVFH